MFVIYNLNIQKNIMKAKNESEFTTMRIKKKVMLVLRRISAEESEKKDYVVHPYELIESWLPKQKRA